MSLIDRTQIGVIQSPLIPTSGSGLSYSNPQLSNLGTTAINADLLPGTSSSINLGSAALQFSNLSLNNLNLYYPGQTTPYGSLNIDANNFAQVILQSLVPRTEVQLLSAANSGGNSGAIRLNTGNASSFSGDIDFVTGTGGQNSGGFNFTTGAPGVNYNSGSFLFQAGSVSGTGVQGSFTVNASSFNISTGPYTGLLIDSNGAATFQSTGAGALFNGPGENTLITTQNSTIGTSGNTTISTGTVGANVYLFTGLTMTANPGDTYTNNGFTFTVIQIPFNTILYAYGTGAPQSAGTLVRTSGSGTASVPYTSGSGGIKTGDLYLTTGTSGAYANTGNIYLGTGSAGSGGTQGSVNITSPLVFGTNGGFASNVTFTGQGFNIASLVSPVNTLYVQSLQFCDTYHDVIGGILENSGTGLALGASYASGGFYGPVTITTANNATGNTGAISLTTGTPTGGVRGSITMSAKALDLTAIDSVILLASTVTAPGTDGAQTINKASGTVNFAAAATSLVVTNSLVTANSLVFAVVRTNDTTAVIKNVVTAAGSFTINLASAATAETSVGFLVINQ